MDKIDFTPYIAVAKMIVQTFGRQCEVILHDLTTPQHSVIHVENNAVTGRRIGDSFRHLINKALDLDAHDDIFGNYYYRKDGRLIRSSSLLIRNAEGRVVGALCINIDSTAIEAQLDFARHMLPGYDEEASPIHVREAAVKTFCSEDNAPTATVMELVNGLIDSAISETMASSDTLTKEKRQEIIRFLDSKDVFLMKGAIERVAERLGIAKVTVYSDIDAVRSVKRA